MEIEEQNNCNGIKRKKPSPTASGNDDRPAAFEVTSKNDSNDVGTGIDAQENQMEDLELMGKSDHEIAETVARMKKTLPSVVQMLPDKGEKLKANIRRHEQELERRKKLQLEKAANGCEETIQLSDHSDEGALHGKKKPSSKSVNFICKKIDEDKDSRTVYAFEKDLPYVNPCQGRKSMLKSQHSVKGRSKKGLSSSRSMKTSVVDNKKQIVSTDENKDDDSKDQPSRNLRPRSVRTCCLVDEEDLAQKFMKNLDPCMKDVTIYYPSRDDPDAIEVDYACIQCLAPESYISSSIMNFYIRYLQQTLSPSDCATCHYHFFNTYFYNKLEKLSYEEDSFLKFRKWWKGVNIFQKAYIFLPIHEHSHWSLVIICLPTMEDEVGPVLLHLDSLGLHDSKTLFDNIKSFLKEEWSYLRKTEAPLDPSIRENLDRTVDKKRVTVPQQKNEYDCGLFVLFYMERFIKEAPVRFRKRDLSMFGRQWFRPQEASNLRATIYDLLVEEFKKVKDNESIPSPKN